MLLRARVIEYTHNQSSSVQPIVWNELPLLKSGGFCCFGLNLRDIGLLYRPIFTNEVYVKLSLISYSDDFILLRGIVQW